MTISDPAATTKLAPKPHDSRHVYLDAGILRVEAKMKQSM
jgi:hypothetical protein